MRRYLNRANLIQENQLLILKKTTNFEKENRKTKLRHEKMGISKNPYVREEMVIEKKPITETRQVSEEMS